MAPAQPSEFVTDGAIAKSAAPLLRAKLEEWGLLEPSANILKVARMFLSLFCTRIEL